MLIWNMSVKSRTERKGCLIMDRMDRYSRVKGSCEVCSDTGALKMIRAAVFLTFYGVDIVTNPTELSY